jgi:hypothetical protein
MNMSWIARMWNAFWDKLTRRTDEEWWDEQW